VVVAGLAENNHLHARSRLRVLWIAYHFPPIGGAGTQRSLKFVSQLPEFDIEPIVVTGPGDASGRWTPHDETLLKEVPASLTIHRVAGPEPADSSGVWKGRKERWLRSRSEWAKWWARSVADAMAGIPDIDLIHVSMSPFEIAGQIGEIAQARRIPWVAGLRDPWALDEMMAYPTWLHRKLEVREMRRALSSAAAIVTTAPEAAVRTRRALPDFEGPITSITNGYDASDFSEPVPPRNDGKFLIVHSGYLHTELGRQRGPAARIRRFLGGELHGVDAGTRSHVYLLEALERLLREDPSLRNVVELHLAGALSAADREVAARSDVVRLLGYIPHAESTALIRSADLLFLPMQNIAAGGRAGIIPGKTYEYLAAGKPILAAVPEGDTREILLAAGSGLVCEPDDVAGMASLIRGQLERWRKRDSDPTPNREYVGRFERRALTASLASILHEVVADPASSS